MRWTKGLICLLTVTLLGCSVAPSGPAIQSLASPAAAGARFPSLDVRDGRIAMSWIEPEHDGIPDRVLVATWDPSGWSEPIDVPPSGDLFINWADFPAVRWVADDQIAAHWLVRIGSPSWAYGIRTALLRDGTWSVPAIPHGRPHPAEHGFVSQLAVADGSVDTIWLDGRKMQNGGTMELRAARWTPDGGYGTETVLDADVCSCCQTDAVQFGETTLVVYRDHTAGEVRDISLLRRTSEGWQAPEKFSKDGWVIAACPVNGPAIATDGSNVAVVWFTQANDDPRVFAKYSSDGGTRWSEAIRIDSGDPIGRVDVAFLDDGTAVASWLENATTDAEVRLQRFGSDGILGEAPLTLGTTGAQRDSGFPVLASNGDELVAAWTETSRPSAVRLLRVAW